MTIAARAYTRSLVQMQLTVCARMLSVQGNPGIYISLRTTNAQQPKNSLSLLIFAVQDMPKVPQRSCGQNESGIMIAKMEVDILLTVMTTDEQPTTFLGSPSGSILQSCKKQTEGELGS